MRMNGSKTIASQSGTQKIDQICDHSHIVVTSFCRNASSLVVEEGKKAQRMGGDVNGVAEGNLLVFGGVWAPKITMSDFFEGTCAVESQMNEGE